jgi:predicted lipoprotein with Yx(FWY)xxD motif
MLRWRNLFFVALAAVMVFGLASLASAQGTATVDAATNPTLGQILTDSAGMTLYVFTKDTAGTSNCTGACLTNWPALTVPAGTQPTAGQGVTGKLGTITRTDDNTTQVTYNDMPLYYWASDKAPGDATGQGVQGVWFVVNPATGPVMAAAAATTAPAATAAATTAPAAAAAATAAPAATAAATAAPAAAATTAAPAAKLPTTGGNIPLGLTLALAAGVVALAAGFGLTMVRRPR